MSCIILSKELNLQSQFEKWKCFELGLGTMIGSAELKDDLCLYSECICQNCNVAWNTKLLHIEGILVLWQFMIIEHISLFPLQVWKCLRSEAHSNFLKLLKKYQLTHIRRPSCNFNFLTTIKYFFLLFPLENPRNVFFMEKISNFCYYFITLI